MSHVSNEAAKIERKVLSSIESKQVPNASPGIVMLPMILNPAEMKMDDKLNAKGQKIYADRWVAARCRFPAIEVTFKTEDGDPAWLAALGIGILSVNAVSSDRETLISLLFMPKNPPKGSAAVNVTGLPADVLARVMAQFGQPK